MNSRLIRWRGNAKENEARVVISGDFCPREENCADVTARAGEITAKVKPYFDAAEFRIVQWECAVTKQDTPIDKSGPNHRCYPECVAFAEALGTDAVLLANNHIGDYGDPGVKDSLDTFRASGIRTAGAGMTPEAQDISNANRWKLPSYNDWIRFVFPIHSITTRYKV